MATTLNFTQSIPNKWEASCTSSGNRMAVQINRSSKGPLLVYGNIDGLEKQILQDLGSDMEKDVIFEIDVPDGIEITIVSFVEVTGAKIVGL